MESRTEATPPEANRTRARNCMSWGQELYVPAPGSILLSPSIASPGSYDHCRFDTDACLGRADFGEFQYTPHIIEEVTEFFTGEPQSVFTLPRILFDKGNSTTPITRVLEKT